MARPKKTKKAEGECIVSLKVNGEVITSSGTTIEEAIAGLKRIQPKTKGIFTIEKGGKVSKPAHLLIRQIVGLFADGMTGNILRSVIIKRMSL